MHRIAWSAVSLPWQLAKGELIRSCLRNTSPLGSSSLDHTRQDGAGGWWVAFGWSSGAQPSTLVSMRERRFWPVATNVLLAHPTWLLLWGATNRGHLTKNPATGGTALRFGGGECVGKRRKRRKFKKVRFSSDCRRQNRFED